MVAELGAIGLSAQDLLVQVAASDAVLADYISHVLTGDAAARDSIRGRLQQAYHSLVAK